MKTQWKNWMALSGLFLSLPASIIIGAGILQLAGMTFLSEPLNKYFPPQSFLLHPVLVLGGLLTSIVMNSIPVFGINVAVQQEGIVTTITTHFRILNMITMALSLFLLCGLILYAFGENFRVVLR